MDPINQDDQISTHFTYKEAMWLPSWSKMGDASDGLTEATVARLKFMFAKMDSVREYFNAPIHVHVAWRPSKYNHQIGGATNSAHRAEVDHAGVPLADDAMEAAVDFDVQGLDCDQARQMILRDNKLEELGLRMEDKPGSTWVHLDCRQPLPGHARFFKP